MSPIVNNLLFGMPPTGVLPAIIMKSVILAIAAAVAAKHYKKVSFVGILLAVVAYQLMGTAFEWATTQSLYVALQDFRMGLPGILIQIVGGFFVLKALSKA